MSKIIRKYDVVSVGYETAVETYATREQARQAMKVEKEAGCNVKIIQKTYVLSESKQVR